MNFTSLKIKYSNLKWMRGSDLLGGKIRLKT